jgi:hypothetical protein
VVIDAELTRLKVMSGPVRDASNVDFKMLAMMGFEKRPSIFMMHPTKH